MISSFIASQGNEPLSNGTKSQNEQNHSILSFPEHDTSQSQQSEGLIDNDHQLKQNAQIIVDDSIQKAQEVKTYHQIYSNYSINSHRFYVRILIKTINCKIFVSIEVKCFV